MNTHTINLNNDLNQIRNLFPSKQGQGAILSGKLQKTNCNPVYFNHNSLQQVLSQKHFGVYLDNKLNFQKHLNNVLSKLNKTIGLLRKLQAF